MKETRHGPEMEVLMEILKEKLCCHCQQPRCYCQQHREIPAWFLTQHHLAYGQVQNTSTFIDTCTKPRTKPWHYIIPSVVTLCAMM